MCPVQMGSTSRPPALEKLSGRSMLITSAPPPRFFIRTFRPARCHTTQSRYPLPGRPLYHEADLSIATHHTDGGGVSHHTFAPAYLRGFYFAPRIPSLTERRLYTFGRAGAWPVFEPFIAGRIDENLITAHWDDVLRLATSVRTGAASASLLLKRLGAYPRQNGLALALR